MTDVKVLYDSFNARYLSFQQVADSFIHNSYFDELILNNHSLLMGPRGCGKTTLLKMLSPGALIYWDEKQKTNIFNDIPFYGVYIPTDIHWKKQLDQLKNDFGENNFTNATSRVTVHINILISLVKTFSFLIDFIKSNQNEEEIIDKEITFSKFLIDNWKLQKPIIPNLNSIEISLLSVVANVNAEIRKKNYNNQYEIRLESFLYFDFIDLSNIALSFFHNIFTELPHKKWAFCFDELEIAPEWLQFQLLEYLRSRSQTILFKLTTAPIISLYKAIKKDHPIINATENNDYKVVRVWTSNQKQFRSWSEFCNQLIRSRISRKYNSRVLPEQVFGNSYLERVLTQSFPTIHYDSRKKDFDFETLSWYLMKDLAQIDNSFERFLIKKSINPLNPTPNNNKEKDEIFRKIKQLAIYRHQFIKSGSTKRSRKVVPLYYGIPLIYELCDGNPRILIGMIDEFLNLSHNKQSDLRELNINEQSRILSEISSRYLSIISSHPDANVTINDRNLNLKELLQTIGNYFFSRMVEEPFTMDTIGSFKVDEEINNKLLELLELALYLGAIVYLDHDESLSKKGIVGKRFRLSYTLAPTFGLLCREFGEIKLSTILKRSLIKQQQNTLFDDNGIN